MRGSVVDRAFQISLRVAGRTLVVETNHPSIEAYLSRACARFSFPQSPVTGAPHDRGAIRWDGEAGSVWFNGRQVARSTGCEPLEAGIRGLATLLTELLRSQSERQALYAVGFARGQACVALAAAPGAGKTTVALELLRRGWSIFGDEFLLLDRDSLAVEGVPLALMVREPSLAVLGDERLERIIRRGMLSSTIGGVRTWHDVDVERTFGAGAVAKPQRLTHLVVYERTDVADASLERISHAAATLEILPHFFFGKLSVDDMWETVARFEAVPCFRLRANDFRSAADLLDALA